MNKEMQKLLDKVNAAKEKKAAEVAEIERRIEAQHEAARAAQSDAVEAFEKMDVSGYHAAQDAQRAAQDAAKMLEQHLQRAKAAPGMTPEEYKATEMQIREEYQETLQTLRGKIAEHIKAIAELYPEIERTWIAGQDALHAMQYDVMDDAPCIMNSSGKKVIVPSLGKKLPEITLRGDIDCMLDSALRGEDPLTRWNK